MCSFTYQHVRHLLKFHPRACGTNRENSQRCQFLGTLFGKTHFFFFFFKLNLLFFKRPLLLPVPALLDIYVLLVFTQILDRIFQELSETWWVILIGLAISMIMSFFWTVLMRFAAGLMIWLSIAFILVLQGGGNFFPY